MSKEKTEQKAPDASAAYAKVNSNCPSQRAVTRECQNPQTPRKITNEDWQYGIGLN